MQRQFLQRLVNLGEVRRQEIGEIGIPQSFVLEVGSRKGIPLTRQEPGKPDNVRCQGIHIIF
jgi:hypothetical protein